MRGLGIITALRDSSLSIDKKRRVLTAARRTAAQILEDIKPLADALHLSVEVPAVPDLVCAPEGIDLAPYLGMLRWRLEDGEQLRGIAFAYTVGRHNLVDMVPTRLPKRVDAVWKSLVPGKFDLKIDLLDSAAFVAVTDRRVITATPREFLDLGEPGEEFPLDKVKYVRPRTKYVNHVRPTIGVTTEQSDVQWMFPADAAHENIDDLASLIADSVSELVEKRAAIDAPPE